jgi:phenylalanyl-tRNA synthetase beta chain
MKQIEITKYSIQEDVHIKLNGKIIGTFGQINYSVTSEYAAAEDTYVLVMDISSLVENACFTNTFVQLPKYPSSVRDLSIVVNRDVLSADIIKSVKNAVREILEDVTLFDIYTGGQIKMGVKVYHTIYFQIKAYARRR